MNWYRTIFIHIFYGLLYINILHDLGFPTRYLLVDILHWYPPCFGTVEILLQRYFDIYIYTHICIYVYIYIYIYYIYIHIYIYIYIYIKSEHHYIQRYLSTLYIQNIGCQTMPYVSLGQWRHSLVLRVSADESHVFFLDFRATQLYQDCEGIWYFICI